MFPEHLSIACDYGQNKFRKELLLKLFIGFWIHFLVISVVKSSHRRCSIKNLFFKILCIHRKTLVLEPLFNKVAGLHACSFIKKRLQHRCFPMNTARFLRTPILRSICERILLNNVQPTTTLITCNSRPELFKIKPEIKLPSSYFQETTIERNAMEINLSLNKKTNSRGYRNRTLTRSELNYFSFKPLSFRDFLDLKKNCLKFPRILSSYLWRQFTFFSEYCYYKFTKVDVNVVKLQIQNSCAIYKIS